MKRRVGTCFGLVLFSFFAFLHVMSPSRQAYAQKKGERFERRFVFKNGGRLTLENTRGDIQIRSWAEERVELKVETIGISDEEIELVPVAIEALEDEIKIASLYPVYAPEFKVTVNYQLRVPAAVDLKLIKSVNGNVKVSDIMGRAIIEVENGEVLVKGFSGTLKARTVNGKIEAEVLKITENCHTSLESYNGDISLRLPKRVKAHWVVRTLNGTVESDIHLPVTSNFGPHVAYFNDVENPVIKAYSVNGDIFIDER